MSEDHNVPNEGETNEVNATDGAKSKAQELGVDLSQVQGRGTDGKIEVPDVLRAAREQAQEEGTGSASFRLIGVDPTYLGVASREIDGERYEFGQGAPTPVTEEVYQELTDDQGELEYPMVEEKKGGES